MAHVQPIEADTDEALMQRFGRGDVSAFDTLYRRHEMGTWRFILRSVKSAAVADDLLQDVWFAVSRQAGKYEPRAKFRTWLFTMAHNRVVDHFRAAHPSISLDADPDDTDFGTRDTSMAGIAADSGFGPVRKLESRQQAQALLDAIEALPQMQRQCFMLQAEGGLEVEEIARVTGVSFETAKSRLRYARNRLRNTLKEFA